MDENEATKRPAVPARVEATGGSITWTIPLTITVSIGAPVASPAPDKAGEVEGLFDFFGRPTPPPPPPPTFSLPKLSTTGFGWSTALSLAMASDLAYQEKGAVESTAVQSWRFADCKFIERGATQCFVANAPGVVLVSFRGSSQFRDWLSNLQIESATLSGLTVHKGFRDQFTAVRSEVEGILNANSDRRVLITGHSLGGAIAVIAAIAWRSKYKVGGLYTYGQPAVGRGDFVNFMTQNYGGKYFRFVNNSDIVPRVPPGYDHAGQLLQFNGSGGLSSQGTEAIAAEAAEETTETMTKAEFEQLQEQLRSETSDGPAAATESIGLEGANESILTIFSDHSMKEYVSKVQKQALANP